MQEWIIGKAIQEARKRKQITLSQLSRGFCSAKEISRLEHGEKEADLELLEALLQRVGESLDDYDVYVDDEEFFKYYSKQHMEKLLDKEDYEALREEAEKMNHNPICTGKIMQQFFCLVEAELLYQKHKPKEVRTYLEKAMELTDLRLEGEMCYTTTELRILMKWVYISKNGEREELCERICAYIEKGNLSESETIKIYPKFLLETARQAAHENPEEAIHCCERGIAYLQKNMSLQYLPDLFYQKIRLGKGTYSECVQTYELFLAMKQQKRAKDLKKYAEEKHGWQFTESEMLSIITGNGKG